MRAGAPRLAERRSCGPSRRAARRALPRPWPRGATVAARDRRPAVRRAAADAAPLRGALRGLRRTPRLSPSSCRRPAGPLAGGQRGRLHVARYPRAALLAMACDELFAPEARRGVLRRMRALRDAESLAFESTFVASDGHRLPVEVSLRRVDAADQPRVPGRRARPRQPPRARRAAERGRSHADELTGLLEPASASSPRSARRASGRAG